MTYREPAPRQPRLFYVAAAWKKNDGMNATLGAFVWALEADAALEKVMKTYNVEHRSQFWYWDVICGEDFAEREAKGPPP